MLEGYGNNDGVGMSILADELIIGTVKHIAGRMKKVKPVVDSLVLFIDESAAIFEHSKYPASFIFDAYSELRQRILGHNVGEVFNTALLMTSRSVNAYESTETGRIILPAKLASTLPVDHMVDNIWIPSLHAANSATLIGIDARERSMLKWLAASVSAAPLLVELMGTALRAEFADTWSSATTTTSSSSQQGLSLTQSMGAVLSAFDGMQKSCYPDVRFPAGEYLYALINEEYIDMDDTAQQHIRSSMFTNSITYICSGRIIYPRLVPESSLCLLASTSAVNADDVIARAIQDEFKEIWNNLVNHLTRSPPSSPPPSIPPGQPPLLEDMFARVLRTRILSTHLHERRRGMTTLRALLAIDNISDGIKCITGGEPYNAAKISTTGKTVVQAGVKKNINKWEAATFESSRGLYSYRKHHFLWDLLSCELIVPDELVGIDEPLPSIRNLTAWKESFRAIDSDSNFVMKVPRNDHCNNLMLFGKMALSSSSRSSSSSNMASTSTSSDGRENIVVVFAEGESNGDSNQIWRGHFIQQGKAGKEKGPYDRYEKFCQAVASITESDLEGDRGYLRALKEGRFIYVYVTTHAGPMVYLAPQDLPHIQTNSLGVLVLNRDVTKRIMRATYDVYALTRSAM